MVSFWVTSCVCCTSPTNPLLEWVSGICYANCGDIWLKLLYICITCITTCSLLSILLDSVKYPVYLLYSFFTPQQGDRYCCRASVRPSMCSCLDSLHMLSNSDMTQNIRFIKFVHYSEMADACLFLCRNSLIQFTASQTLSKNFLPVIMVIFQRRARNVLKVRRQGFVFQFSRYLSSKL